MLVVVRPLHGLSFLFVIHRECYQLQRLQHLVSGRTTAILKAVLPRTVSKAKAVRCACGSAEHGAVVLPAHVDAEILVSQQGLAGSFVDLGGCEHLHIAN